MDVSPHASIAYIQAMKLKPYLTFLNTEDGYSFWGVVALAFISGIANTAILALINVAAKDLDAHSTAIPTAVLFIFLVSLAMGAEAIMIKRAITTVEYAIHAARCRFIKGLQDCEFIDLQRMGRGRLYAGISNNLQSLSASSWNLAISAKMVPLVIGTSAYMLYLSPTGFLVMAIAIFLILLLFLKNTRTNGNSDKNPNAEIYDGVADILSATREARLNSRRAAKSSQRFQETSEKVRAQTYAKEHSIATKYVFSQAAFFMLIGSMIFIAPVLSETFGETVQQSTTAILFLIGPVGAIVSSVPQLQTCLKAITEVTNLQKELEKNSFRPNGNTSEVPPDHLNSFEEVKFDNIEFTHEVNKQEGGFTVGPITFSVERGSITFITGGNGSGKSTLLHLVTTLYPMFAGRIQIDGTNVRKGELPAYRNLFAAVFSDFYLDRHLDSLIESDIPSLNSWLKILEMDRSVMVQEGRFTTTDLSTGQRKRLALAIALAENKPILILDEWAADQDPHFRKKFYREILVKIQSEGRTIIAVTHDDAYFDVCDQLVQLRDGQAISISGGLVNG